MLINIILIALVAAYISGNRYVSRFNAPDFSDGLTEEELAELEMR